MSGGNHTGHPPSELHREHEHEAARPTGFWRSKAALTLIGFLLIGGFLLVSEHRLHALGYLPYLLVLACPLLHMFHGGHGSHGAHNRATSSERNDQRD
ncbi:DUF2933 domain-containing protein [Sinorhizobium sp. GL28]|uniref:DUF2933 domain-containing protein n=1 Tax=Sinorhizobium sp. GL28 TaxID=1358418 RepID=UPI00071E2C7B|nr:DUF2933 domain-containing protein [Sinorhizobium sp. GL28]KSV82924.1 hypothetical protein N184_35260 [Sinorhizobium sp. GL28]